jgi:hypothetical protein
MDKHFCLSGGCLYLSVGKYFCSFTNYKENAQKPKAYSKYTGHVPARYRMNRTDTGNLPNEHRIKRIYNYEIPGEYQIKRIHSNKIPDKYQIKRVVNVNVPYVNIFALKGRECQNYGENASKTC